MAINKGKQWEEKIKEDFKKIPDTSIDRLYDVYNGYKNIRQVCDFIAYHYPYIWYIEAKEHKGNTFPFNCLRQYDDLCSKVGIRGVHAGVLLWFQDHDAVWWVPIEEIIRMKSDGCKSINIKMLEEKLYNIIEIPSKKKRVFLECDYTELLKGEF